MVVRGLPSSASWQDLKVSEVGYSLIMIFFVWLDMFVNPCQKCFRIICGKLVMSVLLKFLVTVKVLSELRAEITHLCLCDLVLLTIWIYLKNCQVFSLPIIFLSVQ